MFFSFGFLNLLNPFIPYEQYADPCLFLLIFGGWEVEEVWDAHLRRQLHFPKGSIFSRSEI